LLSLRQYLDLHRAHQGRSSPAAGAERCIASPAGRTDVVEDHTMAHPAVYGLSLRHDLATRTIESYAAKQPKGDLATGIAGKVLPAGGMVGAIARLAMQVADLYQPLARDLAVIYEVRVEVISQQTIAADERSARIGAALAA